MFYFEQKVLFKHCDPAGIVFFPRYFEMLNDTNEEFFESGLKYSFVQILKTGGVPTAQINAKFLAPSMHGDELVISLRVARLGRSSVDLIYEANCDKQLRFEASSTLVYVDDSGKPNLWPEALRQAIEHQMQGDDQCQL